MKLQGLYLKKPGTHIVMKEYYRILELDESASIDELNEQYRNKIKQFHPDLFAGDKNKEKLAVEKTKRINIAYSELKKRLAEKEKNKIKLTGNEILHQGKQILMEEGRAFAKAVGSVLKNLSDILFSDDAKSETAENKDLWQTGSKHKSSPKFDEILIKKMRSDQSKATEKSSNSKSYQEMLKKRSLYGSRQKETQSGKGPISPISAIKGIRSSRIE